MRNFQFENHPDQFDEVRIARINTWDSITKSICKTIGDDFYNECESIIAENKPIWLIFFFSPSTAYGISLPLDRESYLRIYPSWQECERFCLENKLVVKKSPSDCPFTNEIVSGESEEEIIDWQNAPEREIFVSTIFGEERKQPKKWRGLFKGMFQDNNPMKQIVGLSDDINPIANRHGEFVELRESTGNGFINSLKSIISDPDSTEEEILEAKVLLYKEKKIFYGSRGRKAKQLIRELAKAQRESEIKEFWRMIFPHPVKREILSTGTQ